MEYKQMEYTDRFSHYGIILAHDIYKDHEFVVKSLGSHPTAYVKLHADDDIYHACHEDGEMNYDAAYVDVHGGVTYGTDTGLLYSDDNGNEDRLDGCWIGWDYAHAYDFCYYSGLATEPTDWEKRWTTEEIVAECKNVIDQIVKADQEASRKDGEMNRVHVVDQFGGRYIRAIFEEVNLDIIVLINDWVLSIAEQDKLFEAIATAVDEDCRTEEELTEFVNSLASKDDPDGLGLECLNGGFTVIVRPIS